jgi:hypothetical protein
MQKNETHPESYFVYSDTLINHLLGWTRTSELSHLAVLEIHQLSTVWIDASNISQDLLCFTIEDFAGSGGQEMEMNGKQ